MLSSRRVVADFKHQKAMQQEVAADKVLCNQKILEQKLLYTLTQQLKVEQTVNGLL